MTLFHTLRFDLQSRKHLADHKKGTGVIKAGFTRHANPHMSPVALHRGILLDAFTDSVRSKLTEKTRADRDVSHTNNGTTALGTQVAHNQPAATPHSAPRMRVPNLTITIAVSAANSALMPTNIQVERSE